MGPCSIHAYGLWMTCMAASTEVAHAWPLKLANANVDVQNDMLDLWSNAGLNTKP